MRAAPPPEIKPILIPPVWLPIVPPLGLQLARDKHKTKKKPSN